MTIDPQMMRDALAKARKDLAPLLKEQERDELGRFAGGSGDGGGRTDVSSHMTDTGSSASDLRDVAGRLARDAKNPKQGPDETNLSSHEDMKMDHGMMAGEHEDLRDQAAAAGNERAAELHDLAATAHQEAADAHQGAASEDGGMGYSEAMRDASRASRDASEASRAAETATTGRD